MADASIEEYTRRLTQSAYLSTQFINIEFAAFLLKSVILKIPLMSPAPQPVVG